MAIYEVMSIAVLGLCGRKRCISEWLRRVLWEWQQGVDEMHPFYGLSFRMV